MEIRLWRMLCWSVGALTGLLIFVGLVASANALFALRGPDVLYEPPGLPNLLLRIAVAPADLVRAICPSFDNMLLHPVVAFFGWAVLGTVLGEAVWQIAHRFSSTPPSNG